MVLLGQAVYSAFPDVHVAVQDLITAEGMVVERTTASGTHLGEFQGVAATGNPVVWSETHIYRLANGKIVEYWPQVDVLAILIQIGAVPPPGGQ
jgi:predicted ester cyclase